MSWIDRLLGRPGPSTSSEPGQRSLETMPGWWLETLGAGGGAATGVNVTRERALRLNAVATCVRVISEDVAALPLHLYRRLDPRGKERATDHPLYGLLHSLPNPELTSYELRETLTGHMLTWGWGYCEIEYDGAGRRRGLWPLRPDRVKRIPSARPGGQGSYEITLPDQSKVILPRWRIWTIRGWSLEAWEAGSLIEAGRDGIGLGIAAEEYGSRFFGNDSRPGGVLEHPGKLSEQAGKRMRESWNAQHSGLSNAHRVAILEEGVKWQQIGISPENAQFLETRKFQRSEIAGLFRVPPHKIGDLEKATFSNIEQQSIDYVNDALVPVCTRFEQTIYRDLLSPAERNAYFAEHLLAGRLRGEQLPRYQAYAIGRTNGWLSADDIREMENMNPLPDGVGQEYLVPLNMAPAGQDQASGDGGQGTGTRSFAALRMTKINDVGSSPDANQDDRREERRRVERRDVAMGRSRLGKSFRPAIAAVAQRVVNREVNDLQNATKKGRANFVEWLRTFLDGHDTVVAEYMGPTIRTFADQVIMDVEREVGRPAPESLQDFTEGYIRSRAKIWVDGLRRGILKIDEGEYEDDEAWAAELTGWLTQRKAEHADDWGREESIRVLGAVARVAYAAMAVAMLVWMAVGETCPYCQEFDGMTVSIERQFLPAGDALTPEGEMAFMSETDVGHPPLHNGCDCVVVAG